MASESASGRGNGTIFLFLCCILAAVPLRGADFGTRATHGFSADVPQQWTRETGKAFSGTTLSAVSPEGAVLQISSAPGCAPLSVLRDHLKRVLTVQYSPAGKIQTSDCTVSGAKGVLFTFADRQNFRIRYAAVPFGTRTYAVIVVIPPGKKTPWLEPLLKSIRFIPE